VTRPIIRRDPNCAKMLAQQMSQTVNFIVHFQV
jgi:hypothetical protein